MQIQDAVEEFLRYCAIERQLSQHTVQAYTADLIDFSRRLPTDFEIGELSTGTLKNYLNEMVSVRKLAVATVRRRFACLRVFCRRLVDKGELADPFSELKLRLPRRKRLPRTLSRREVSSLIHQEASVLRAEPERTLAIALQLIVSTGVRVGELCKIRCEDVSSDGGAIRIHGKGARDRVVFISDTKLREWLGRAIQRRGRHSDRSAPLFVNRHGSPMKPQSVRSKLRRHAKKVGILRRVTPHMLRHTAATLLIETGVDIRFVQRLLGHSSISTTEIYTHVSDTALKSTLERADVLAALTRDVRT